MDKTLDNAKSLRTKQTESEQRLWYHLRAHRFMGMKFKRQKPIGRYIVDFVCIEHRLIIELDGGQHAEQAGYDQQRDARLRSEGYTVLRFWNNDVMQNLDGVLEQIRLSVAPSLSPGPFTRKRYTGGYPAATQRPFRSPTSGRGEQKTSPCP